MNKVVILLCLFLSQFRFDSVAQPSTCFNADFETNGFTGWSGSTGWCCPINSTTSGIVPGRHTIMTGNGTDPNTNNQLTVVAPGGTYSVRLGNDFTGSEAEQLRYSFLVTQQTQMFVYRYAVVLEDPAHSIFDQPRFEIKVYDQNGTVDTMCGVYEVYAAAGIPGFQTVTGAFGSVIHWKDWTTVGIDLSSKLGSTITIEFSTGDCALGAHFGYAYIDCICYPFDVLSDFCPGSFTATLTAPQGFASYLWNTGDTTRSIDIVNPVIGDTFTVLMTSVTGCDVTLNSIIRETLVASAYSLSDSCFNSAYFIDSSYIVTGTPITGWLWDFGDGDTSTLQNPTHVYPGPGIYNATLIVTNEGGCKDTVNQVVTVKDIPLAGFVYNPVCPGDSTFFTDTTLTATSGITSWQWDFGDGTPVTGIQHPSHIYQQPGNYDVTLIAQDAFGCKDTAVVTVNTNAAAISGFSYVTDCINAEVSFTDTSKLSGGNITSWTWYFGDGNTSTQQHPQHSYPGPGTYTVSLVTVVDGLCSDSMSRQITLLDKPTAAFSTGPVCDGAATEFTDNSSLPGSSVTGWNWNFGDGGVSTDRHPKHIYNAPGQYNVTLVATGANGCRDTLVQPVTVNASPDADFSYLPSCPGQVMQFQDGTGFPSPLNNSWLWNFGDFSPASTDENPQHIYNSAGPFLATLIVTAENGCRDTVTKNVITSIAPVAGFVTPTGCPGLPVTFQSGSTIAAGTIDTILWNFGDGSPTATGINANHIYNQFGAYNVTITAISNTGCRDVFTAEVNISPPPTANFTANVVCVGNPVSFADLTPGIPSPIISWNWNFGDGSTSTDRNPQHVFINDSLNTITLVVMNSGGCVDTGQKVIFVNPLPIVDFSSSSPQCVNDDIRFFNHVITPAGIQQLQWNYGDGSPLSPGANPVHIYSMPGVYQVELIATDNNNCRDSITHSISVLNVPVMNFTAASACLNEENHFNDQSVLSGGSVTGWNWQFGDGSSDTVKNTMHVYAQPGAYNVVLEVTGSNGCSETDSMITHVHPLPVASFTAEHACDQQPVSFTDLSSPNTIAWSWDFGDGVSSLQQHPVHQYANGNSFNVMLAIESDSGCADTLMQQVIIHPLPAPDFISDSVCFGNETHFESACSIPSGSIDSYQWLFGDGGAGSGQNPAYIYSQPGIFYGTLTTISDEGCMDSVTKPVKVYRLPEAALIADNLTGCKPLEVAFSDLSVANEGTLIAWWWHFGNGNTSNYQHPGNVYEEAGVYDVSLTVTNSVFCSDSVYVDDYITVYEKPVAGFDYDPAPASILQPVVSFEDHSLYAIEWFYDLGDNSTSNESNPQHQYAEGIYEVMQVVTSDFGCTDTAFRMVEVKGAFTLYIPNAFSPNNDGHNDIFYAYGTGITEFNMLILNRWGQPVFESDAMNEGWDGSVNDQQGKEDVYYYVAKVKDAFEKEHTVNGRVTVVY